MAETNRYADNENIKKENNIGLWSAKVRQVRAMGTPPLPHTPP